MVSPRDSALPARHVTRAPSASAGAHADRRQVGQADKLAGDRVVEHRPGGREGERVGLQGVEVIASPMPGIDRLVAYGAVAWPRLRASWRR